MRQSQPSWKMNPLNDRRATPTSQRFPPAQTPTDQTRPSVPTGGASAEATAAPSSSQSNAPTALRGSDASLKKRSAARRLNERWRAGGWTGGRRCRQHLQYSGPWGLFPAGGSGPGNCHCPRWLPTADCKSLDSRPPGCDLLPCACCRCGAWAWGAAWTQRPRSAGLRVRRAVPTCPEHDGRRRRHGRSIIAAFDDLCWTASSSGWSF